MCVYKNCNGLDKIDWSKDVTYTKQDKSDFFP